MRDGGGRLRRRPARPENDAHAVRRLQVCPQPQVEHDFFNRESLSLTMTRGTQCSSRASLRSLPLSQPQVSGSARSVALRDRIGIIIRELHRHRP